MFFNKTKKVLAQTEETLTQVQQSLTETKKQLEDTEGKLIKTGEELQSKKNANTELTVKYSVFIEKDKAIDDLNLEIAKLKNDLTLLNEKYQNGISVFSTLENEINLYQDTLEIGSFGLYQPQFNYPTSNDYKNALEENYKKQKQLIKVDLAAICNTEWTVGGSKAEGRKMTNQYKKLMLFAFNGECDSCMARVKWNNAAKTKDRIEKAYESINKLGVTSNVHLSTEFLNLKFQELALTHEYELKQHAEKEEQRRIREQMREEEKAQREFERAQREAEDDERRFQKALDKAKEEMGTASDQTLIALNQQVVMLEQKLKEAHEKKERAKSLAQQTKVGHIYIISSIGSFGEDIYKIGLTRRLDPLDRIRELGDASVPFNFDVHAIIYSENAPQLEYDLHKKFGDRRLNRINGRREFFKANLEEIEEFVKQHANAEIEFIKIAEAKEYRETLTLLEQLNYAINEHSTKSKFPMSLS
jgi:hypothetical protein